MSISLEDIPRRYPDIDLGLIPTGAPPSLVTVVTLTGEQGVKAVEITKPRTAIPIFKEAVQASTTTTKFVYLTDGETYTFTPNEWLPLTFRHEHVGLRSPSGRHLRA